MKRLFLFNLVALSLIVASCSSSQRKTTDEMSADSVASEDLSARSLDLNGDSDSKTAGILRTVNFGFDSSRISSSAREIVMANAAFLKANSAVEVQVEGHCDERGGIQYNLALGERRAKAVRDLLVAYGVNANRISTVSYGKERPLAYGHDEGSWDQNRRANFVITAK